MKLRIFLSVFILLALILTPIEAADDRTAVGSLNSQFHNLTSRIKSLESLVDKKNEELKSKDEIIVEKEKIIKEKSDIITSLQREVALLKVVHDAWLPPWLSARVSYAKSHWNEHGKPSFEYLMRKTLEEKAQAEKWIKPHLQTIKTKCVSAAREQWFLVRTKVDVKSLSKIAKEVYVQSKDVLTPHMIYIREVLVSYFQPYADKHWSEHVKRASEHLMHKVSEKKAQAEKWIEPHAQTIKTKCVSAAREQWLLVRTNVDAKSVSKIAKEVYIQSRDALISHISNIKEVTDTLFRAAKKVSDTYITTKSHFDKAWETMAPYKKQAVIAYGKFLELLYSIIRFLASWRDH